ncbi:organic cation transporter protein-like [Ciona intestinalis]
MSTNTTMYAILMFLCGCGALVNYMAAALLSSEVVPSGNRVLMFSFVQGGFSLGYTILPLIGYLFQNWRWFLRATSLLGLLYMPYFWLIDESPRWLAAVGRDKEADEILLKIAKHNNLRIESDHKESEANICNEEKNSDINTETVDEKLGVLKTLKQAARRPVLIRRMLIVNSYPNQRHPHISYEKEFTDGFQMFRTCFINFRFCINLIYYVIGLNSNSLSGNRFINVFLFGLLDIAATLWFYLTADKLGRRNSYIAMVTMMAVFTVLTPFAGKWHPTLTNVLVCTSKLIASAEFSIIILYTGELFPTALRHSITGISNAVGRIGGITAPYVLYAGDPTSSITTSIIIASVLLASAVLFFFLPKTVNQTLPQSIEDAVNMKRFVRPSLTTKLFVSLCI